MIQFRWKSRIIDRLVRNGDTLENFSQLLLRLGIHESSDDITELLTIYDPSTMCDELCAPTVIAKILSKNILLDKLTDNHIINIADMCGDKCIHAYNNGYRIIMDDKIGCCKLYPITIINNAVHNGLFIRSIYAHHDITSDKTELSPSVTNNITDIAWNSDQDGTAIFQLCKNVENIHSTYINNLKELSFVKNIKKLRMADITDDDLKLFANLRELDLWFNKNTTTCNQVANTLRFLYANRSIISDNGIQMCKKIRKLSVANNMNITTCAPFAHSLIVLNAASSGITDAGLVCCLRIKVLNANFNNKITTCEPFAKTLKTLEACSAINEPCGITSGGLTRCYNLRNLYIEFNYTIDTISGFPLLKRIVYYGINLNIHSNSQLNIKRELESRKHIAVTRC